MSFVCVICEESLTYKDPSVRENCDSRLINTTLCGHIFHTSCLNKWFAVQQKRSLESITPQQRRNNRTTCPSCQQQVFQHQCLRVYPTEENDSTRSMPIDKTKAQLKEEIADLKKKLAAAEITNKKTEMEMDARINSLQYMSIENEKLEQAKLVSLQIPKNSATKTRRLSTTHRQILNSLPVPALAAISMIAGPNSESMPARASGNIISLSGTKGGLRIKDKVIWMCGDSSEVGQVLWIGEVRCLLSAGVEFVAAIGDEAGIPEIDGKKVFTCRAGYGRLVPVKELILYVDFYGCNASSDEREISSVVLPTLQIMMDNVN